MNKYALDIRTATDHFPGIGRYVSGLLDAMIPILEENERLMLVTSTESRAAGAAAVSVSDRVGEIHVEASPFSLRQQWMVRSRLREASISLYHSPYILMPYWLPQPSVVTIHDLIPLTRPDDVSLKARMMFRQLLKLATRRASHVITDSQSTLHDLIDVHPDLAKHATTVTLAAGRQFQPPAQEELSRVQRAHELPPRYVLYLGSNKPHKNIHRLIEAAVSARQTCGEGFHLVLAGAWDPGFTDPRKIVRSLGACEWTRWISPVEERDLPALYAGAAAFIFPSLYEGFGFPVIEAMACGAPVACSNASSLPEVAGDAALLFAPESPSSIEEAMTRIWQDASVAEDLREKGFRQAARFSWERTARKTLEIYRGVARIES
jgi:alpha-1,3-rhamnosyl/mannosyltransferase